MEGAVRWGGAAMIDGDEWQELVPEADALTIEGVGGVTCLVFGVYKRR
jgi:hypothetical protein